MFASTFTVATLALSMVGSASAIHVPRKAAPAGWWFEGLENYDVYHTRYLALNCQTQHNTDFFDLCCHPMLNTENLTDNRDASCTPSTAASSSASAAEPTSTIDTGNEGFDNSNNSGSNSGDNTDNNSGDDSDDEDYDDDDEWECDDDEESSSAEAPAATTSVWSTSEDKPTSTKAPKPTSTKEAEPTTTDEPTSTKEPKPSTTKEAEPTSTSGGNSGSGGSYPGTITFYDQGGVAGACGDFHSDNDDIAAIAFDMYGNIGAKSALCGQKIQITNEANGNSITVTIADACEGCKDTQFDLSTGAFNKLADPNLGLVDVTIQWL